MEFSIRNIVKLFCKHEYKDGKCIKCGLEECI